MPPAPAKVPDYAELGRRAMRKRWGPPRHVNLKDLDTIDREVVEVVIAALRRRKTQRDAEA